MNTSSFNTEEILRIELIWIVSTDESDKLRLEMAENYTRK